MHFDMLDRLVQAQLNRIPLDRYCKLVNLRNALRFKKHRIAPAPGEDPAIHVASDATDRIFICRRGRHNRYKRGVMVGVDRLARDYGLDRLADLRDGVFIDCGANVGELGFWARKRRFQYIPFEPEALESRCVDLNHFEGRAGCIRKALWKEETVLKFYHRADSADSSALANSEAEPFTSIDAVPLDKAVDLTGITGPVIFKLEAEGAEPEVLEGAVTNLKRIDWLAVDCGPERGPQHAHTFVETNTFLYDHGFRLVAAEFNRVTALYRRVGSEFGPRS